MSKPETAVRIAAQALHLAITEARAEGIIVSWPSSPDGLTRIVINETGRFVVRNLDDNPVRDADGMIAGEPLDLTDAERALLPALDPDAVDDPASRIAGAMTGRRKAPKQ